MVYWCVAAGIAAVIAAGLPSALKEMEFARLEAGTVTLGYLCLMLILLAGLRTISAYIRLDNFKLQLLKLMKLEEQRRETLKALRPSQIFSDVSQAPPMRVLPARHAK